MNREGTVFGSPVFGLRPGRSVCQTDRKVPKFCNTNDWSFANASIVFRIRQSSVMRTCRSWNPVSSASCRMSSCLFILMIVLLLLILYLSGLNLCNRIGSGWCNRTGSRQSNRPFAASGTPRFLPGERRGSRCRESNGVFILFRDGRHLHRRHRRQTRWSRRNGAIYEGRSCLSYIGW